MDILCDKCKLIKNDLGNDLEEINFQILLLNNKLKDEMEKVIKLTKEIQKKDTRITYLEEENDKLMILKG